MWVFVIIATFAFVVAFWDIKRDFFIAMIGFIGSLIGGAMTLVGGRITLKDQNKKYIDQQTLSNHFQGDVKCKKRLVLTVVM
ncbi:hypothetical protein [Brevibacillus reuszeri]|uniref:hypothetical protein n=1 Tax=Brevibacillus reuszeri TaxID=54915 RepID=UPI000CCC3325|nr:hypothetical protein [Brevibacillus reuszeri]